MPVKVDIEGVSGKKTRVELPVEIWQRGGAWTFKAATQEPIRSVTIDPEHSLPDINHENNVWKPASYNAEPDVN
jgi:hypothetical protein